jgi:hypothetical protein
VTAAAGVSEVVGVAGPEAQPACEPTKGEGVPFATQFAAPAPVAPVLVALAWDGNGGGGLPGDASAAIAAADQPPSPRQGPSPPADQGMPMPDALAASLPLARGLLVEGVALGVGRVECAVQALTEPLLTAEGSSAVFLYWAGFSSWVVAAAMACEAARRSWRRRPALAASPDLAPEADP